MKTFAEYLDKMGYSWNDFDHTYEMEGLIEQYADERVKQAETSTIPDTTKSLKCDCKHSGSCRYEEVVLETNELCRHKE